MRSYNELEALVITWAHQKGILDNGTPHAQAMKTWEETDELITAIDSNNKAEIEDALGDILVTIIIQAEMQKMSLIDCLESAYNIISKRTGKMVGGQFVKDVTEHSGFDSNNTDIA
jgi:NTP pyrophosphatase (non-canonical NTP hydrolase)